MAINIDPRVSLAMAMHANPGVYALLLGSGVSRSAGIPTGWEVVLDLIAKLAAASGEDCEPDREAWYRNKYGEEPTYSGLLQSVGQSQAERSRLLTAYFEPSESEEEVEAGDKMPTKAHHAIASLVRRKAIRVILTTNFDRLIERALESAGLSPTVISTPEAVAGAPPLVHSDCTVVKLHGDYMGLRTKNTPEELSVYDPAIDALLDRVLDEYGLIVCGWSGAWDEALRKAIERRKNRRFTTWWTCHGQPSETGRELIALIGAERILIESADEFFEDLAEKLGALDALDKTHPVSVDIAVERTKKYVSEAKYDIQLDHLLMGEANRIADEINSDKYPVDGGFADQDYLQRIRQFDALSEMAVNILATGCFWDREQRHMDTWLRAVMRVANATDRGIFNPLMMSRECMLDLRKLLPRSLLCAAGVAFAAGHNLRAVYALLSNAKTRDDREAASLVDALTGWPRSDVFQRIRGLAHLGAPISDLCRTQLRPAFLKILSAAEYERAFEMYEVLQCFYFADTIGFAIPSLFMCRRGSNGDSCLDRLVADVADRLEGSEFLAAGFCQGDAGRFLEARNRVQAQMARISPPPVAPR